MIPLRAPAEILPRLEVASAKRLLLVGCPPELVELLRSGAPAGAEVLDVEAGAIRSVKEPYDWIFVFQESRVGSRAILDGAVKRLEPGGRIWVATAMRKVQGPRVAAARRLEAADIDKALEKTNLRRDREARISAWHVAYRFSKSAGG
jgi:aminopeptidase-like protein